jgi:ribose transport system substrate-binding protein
MKRKSAISALAVAGVALALAACSTSGAASSGGSGGFEKKSPLTVGYSTQDMKYEYFQLYAQGIKDTAKKLGWKFVLSDQKSSEQTQVSGSADLINQGISGLIVSPIQPDALPATVLAAHAAKIPIVIGDVGAKGDYDAYVQSANYEGGKLAAQYVVKELSSRPGTKDVGVITLDPGIVVGNDRVKGFTDELAKHADFKVVSQVNGHTTTQGGFDVTRDMLAADPGLDAIFTAADPEGLGASNALEQAGKLGGDDGVLLTSFNGDDPALDLILQGKMAATVAQDPYGQGVAAMQAVADLQDGKKPTFDVAKTKTIQFKVVLVTKDNAQEIKDKNAGRLK